MKAQRLHRITDLREDAEPLVLEEVPDPEPGPGELLLEVATCGVCHTELDEIEGRTPPPRLPVILGHQVVGRVVAMGEEVGREAGGEAVAAGTRVGVAWIWSACGACTFCLRGEENLCPDFRATGRDADGGYAELMTVPADFALPIPDVFSDVEAAPLLCAGAIGYRSLRLTGLENGGPLGLTGFGGSGHQVLKMVRHRFPDSDVHVFARNPVEREHALELRAAWAGDTTDRAPQPHRAIIDTTPVWKPVVEALANLEPGGRLVINAIRKEDDDQEVLLELDYAEHLWMEREIKSVANVTRRDVREFLDLAAEIGLRPDTEEFGLEEANRALQELKTGKIRGAKVLRVG
ncbi:MAG: zinc-dependent alcohol dehydrogenase family protein [Gemmatimonadota bacterium]|jgi:propanol-preferring alcohol dehydrogenase